MEIECQSAVSKVVVHARGALVTRAVTLPADLPNGVVDVVLPGVTLQAQAGSARAALEESDRNVAAVHTAVVVPSGSPDRGPTLAKVRELEARAARLADEQSILSGRRTHLLDTSLSPELRPHDGKRQRDAFDVRFAEAIAMARLLANKVADLDSRLYAIEKEQRDVGRAIAAARLEDAQASSKERMGREHPTRKIEVRLTGEGRPGVLLVTYAVAVARWWPTYTLRMFEGGLRATWTFEALVAQRTGEDWNQALLSLSSADLVFDARLPELASLRFGRQQQPKKRPLRAAPAGVDDMFTGYLAFKPAPPAFTPPPVSAHTVYPQDEGALDGLEEEKTAVMHREQTRSMDLKPRLQKRATEPVPPPPAMGGYGGPPPGAMPQGMPARAGAPPMPMSLAAPMPMQMQSRSMPAAKGAGMLGAAVGALFDSDGGGGGAYEPEPELEPELVMGAQWQNLDALVLAGPDDTRRGRLVPSPGSLAAGGSVHELDGLAKDRWVDPSDSRGMFDHRYEAAGRADVPSDGRVHRVGVQTAACNVLIGWRSVPSESLEVYREANVVNPFNTALLGGPVDVYLDGSLLAETKAQRIDKGGVLWCGMGVDDRVKIARNVRADEESAGLLGGSLAVTHTVSIELSSTIKDPIKVKVLERVPVTDDKNIEIKLLKINPQAQAYDQANRGNPIRGGYQFEAAVTGGAKANLEVVYKLVFASKLDIVGGSRRG